MRLSRQALALFASVTTHQPSAPPLSPRKAPEALLPTVPAAQGELTYPEVATAVFEAHGEMLPDQRAGALLTSLSASVRALGLDHIRREVANFTALETEEFPEVAECWYAAYRLCLAFWYHHAAARTLTVGEVAACLYLTEAEPVSRAESARQCAAGGARRAEDLDGAARLDVERAVDAWLRAESARLTEGDSARRAGSARHDLLVGVSVPRAVPVTAVVQLGDAFTSEFAPALAGGQRPARGSWLYRHLVPHAGRRARCWELATTSARWRLPLIVQPRAGTLRWGTTPPPPPAGNGRRPVYEGWAGK